MATGVARLPASDVKTSSEHNVRRQLFLIFGRRTGAIASTPHGSGRVGEAARARVLEMVDQLGYRPHHGARSITLRAGRDLAVLGFDGSVGADLLHPALTSVVIPVEDIAQRVVCRVLRQIEDGQDSKPGEIVATWLREAESTPFHR